MKQICKVICAGYCDLKGVVHKCGYLIKTIVSGRGNKSSVVISHGMCRKCFNLFKHEINKNKKRGGVEHYV